jgi:hypothetical protein
LFNVIHTKPSLACCIPKKSGVSAKGSICLLLIFLIDKRLTIDKAPAAAKLAWAEKHI